MKDLIKKLLRESTGENKMVSINYLKQLLNNTTNKSGKKILKQWVSIGGEKISLTPRQHNLLNDIKRGGPKPGMYNTKN